MDAPYIFELWSEGCTIPGRLHRRYTGDSFKCAAYQFKEDVTGGSHKGWSNGYRRPLFCYGTQRDINGLLMIQGIYTEWEHVKLFANYLNIELREVQVNWDRKKKKLKGGKDEAA